MLDKYIDKKITESLGFTPTEGQMSTIELLSKFVSSVSNPEEIFLLKGYAGTGKTSLIAALVKAFGDMKLKSVLLAPTGRAAKVLSSYASKPAHTIHKKIYRQQSSSDAMGKFSIDANMHTDTFFIVDEASMISNQGYENAVFGSGMLLDDLIKYVYNNKRCKLILAGDTAQLPPVRLNISPALDKSFLSGYGKNLIEFELTHVVRQEKGSGVLANATKLRNIIRESDEYSETLDYPRIDLKEFPDMEKIGGGDLIDKITESYDKYGKLAVSVICRSNKRANRYNQGIRSTILYQEDEISSGDLVMIVKNNYHWAETIPEIDFIANGDIAKIERIRKYTERYGFRFADVTLSFPDYKDIEIDTKIMLDTLHTETPALSQEENQKLFFSVAEDYLEIKNKRKRYKEVRGNEYFNAMQVKFAYAVTCHKAQGGQWQTVFVDQGWLKDDMINKEYLRWLYTAFTRSQGELYLVNFNKEFFEPEPE